MKLTIQLGIEPYSTISDTISLGQNAAGALITHGVATVVGDVALDQLMGNLSNQAKIAIGMDAASLSKPRTVKIKAVSDAARAYPDLARVQQSMALSLEAIKAAAYHEDGTELGDTGAILRKNIMVRAEIATEQVTSIDETWERVLLTDSAPANVSRFVRVRITRP